MSTKDSYKNICGCDNMYMHTKLIFRSFEYKNIDYISDTVSMPAVSISATVTIAPDVSSPLVISIDCRRVISVSSLSTFFLSSSKERLIYL